MSTETTVDAVAEAPADEPILSHHFDDLGQQHVSSMLGMWAFLATEVMFFGGLIGAYAVYRGVYWEAFRQASHHLRVDLGGINTCVLLCSSLAMAMAVHSAQLGRRMPTVWFLLLTVALGTTFLCIKGYEYYIEYNEGFLPGPSFRTGPFVNPQKSEMFFVLYFFMTGLHAFHMIVGIPIVALMAYLVWRRWVSGHGETQVEVVGLYWHFIDIVWVFLYPLLYLIDPSHAS